MALRNIRTIGDDILRKKSKVVEEIDQKVLVIMKDMADTMYKADGAGLAAPQIGVLKRLAVIDVGDGLINLINPEIIETMGSREVVEGCLSVPGKHGKLIRPEKVVVRALDLKGNEFIVTGEGDLAKALCHEIDHLDGVLYIDKIFEVIK